MLTTLLFDLDGTLLPLDLDAFMESYFRALTPKIAHVLDPKRAVALIWAATKDAIADEDPGTTNLDAFKRSFFHSTGLEEKDIWPAIEAFYEIDFDTLRGQTRPTRISQEICRTAVEKGYRLVLATNPIFPAVAIQKRMAWAGLDVKSFDMVTAMEDMHYCKPNPKYYVEILDRLGASPFECMMFGNDVQEDGVAGKLGMQTYLVDDYLIDRGVGHIDFTERGSLADALTFVRQLPDVNK